MSYCKRAFSFSPSSSLPWCLDLPPSFCPLQALLFHCPPSSSCSVIQWKITWAWLISACSCTSVTIMWTAPQRRRSVWERHALQLLIWTQCAVYTLHYHFNQTIVWSLVTGHHVLNWSNSLVLKSINDYDTALLLQNKWKYNLLFLQQHYRDAEYLL